MAEREPEWFVPVPASELKSPTGASSRQALVLKAERFEATRLHKMTGKQMPVLHTNQRRKGELGSSLNLKIAPRRPWQFRQLAYYHVLFRDCLYSVILRPGVGRRIFRDAPDLIVVREAFPRAPTGSWVEKPYSCILQP